MAGWLKTCDLKNIAHFLILRVTSQVAKARKPVGIMRDRYRVIRSLESHSVEVSDFRIIHTNSRYNYFVSHEDKLYIKHNLKVPNRYK